MSTARSCRARHALMPCPIRRGGRRTGVSWVSAAAPPAVSVPAVSSPVAIASRAAAVSRHVNGSFPRDLPRCRAAQPKVWYQTSPTGVGDWRVSHVLASR
eukprot:365933-Chlamydomonas_euryale.AAC.3